MLQYEGNFSLDDIMCSSYNVHFSNQNIKCTSGVPLYLESLEYVFKNKQWGERRYMQKIMKFSVFSS